MARPPIQAVIEMQAELETTRRNWRMVLFNEDGTPFTGGSDGGGLDLAAVQAALDDGTLVLPGGWRAFKNAGAIPQSFWNGWSQVADTPVLFRQNGNQVEFIGHATGGVAAPGNAIVQMPDALQAASPSQDFSGDLRVAVISGHTYVVMIAGTESDYDFSSISYTLA